MLRGRCTAHAVHAQVWVENMNSVMDDNKLLTLPNGERIRLAPHVKLLFEVADLQYASPATISR
jgi:dynein heavy chain